MRIQKNARMLRNTGGYRRIQEDTGLNRILEYKRKQGI